MFLPGRTFRSSASLRLTRHGEGWLFEISLALGSSSAALGRLLDADGYSGLIGR
ncbi:hypothetical protein [Streptomyces sp900116325]|uniref:hypothetical protein n=1 Tax=Streptomyces sp. 900116325 TaxID=3154295 RepID=UPI0033FE4FC0